MTCLSCHFYVAGLCQVLAADPVVDACHRFIYEPGSDEVERG